MNQLKGMLSRDMDSSLDNGDRSKRSAQLVYLSKQRREISLTDHGSRESAMQRQISAVRLTQ